MPDSPPYIWRAIGYYTVLYRLAEHFEYCARKFGKFVKKQYAVVCQAYFSGLRCRASAHQGNGAYGVVRCSERAPGHQH